MINSYVADINQTPFTNRTRMRLRFKNEPRCLDTALIRRAARYYMSRLTGQTFPDVDITIEFRDGLREYQAYCEPVASAYHPRKFNIVINTNLGPKRLLESLAHEMVHVKQYAKGELKDYVYSNHVKWCGVKMLYDEGDDDQYFESPWEIEAYGRQVGLYSGFKYKYLDGKDPQ